ncbi:ATPase [Spirochaetia bacterium]|nr:ATPase [Spirochaetia bacterium]
MTQDPLIIRKTYLNRLRQYQNKDFIKVITGIRRCGKSSLMQLFIDELLQTGVPEENIIHFNFEVVQYEGISNYHLLYDTLMDRMPASGRAYIFLDEIQHVEAWEKAVNSIRVETDADIYITGSNAWLLSSEIATLLSGRYVEIPMLPLSFREYLDFGTFPAEWGNREKFDRYLQYGGFPGVSSLPQENEPVNGFLQGIYNTVIVKDVLSRHALHDVKMFDQLVKFLCQNTGNLVSPSNIAGFLSSQGKTESVKSATVSRYLDLLEKAYIVYPAHRYDIKGKELLKTLSKYYVVDTGIRNMLLGYSNTDLGYVIETVVFFELLRRGFQVFTGKYYAREVDFCAVKQDRKIYYQVTLTMMDEAVRERELNPLMAIKDNYEKVILSMDKTYVTDYEGIKYQNIIDFLLGEW